MDAGPISRHKRNSGFCRFPGILQTMAPHSSKCERISSTVTCLGKESPKAHPSNPRNPKNPDQFPPIHMNLTPQVVGKKQHTPRLGFFQVSAFKPRRLPMISSKEAIRIRRGHPPPRAPKRLVCFVRKSQQWVEVVVFLYMAFLKLDRGS